MFRWDTILAQLEYGVNYLNNAQIFSVNGDALPSSRIAKQKKGAPTTTELPGNKHFAFRGRGGVVGQTGKQRKTQTERLIWPFGRLNRQRSNCVQPRSIFSEQPRLRLEWLSFRPQPQGKDKHVNLNQLRMLDGGNKQPFYHINNHKDKTNSI